MGTSDSGTLEALGCLDGTCDRFYEPSRGYFSVKDNGRFVRGNPNHQPQCRQHDPEVTFLYLTREDEELLLACPRCGTPAPTPAALKAAILDASV